MNFARPYNTTIALIMMVIYLAMPTTNFACVSIMVADVSSRQEISTTAVPGDTCPCSDSQESGCCDTTCCHCGCHVLFGNGLLPAYTPVIITRSLQEQSWLLPQVYRSIFVPPQNPA